MWQVFSLKLVKLPVDDGPVELYGYIAARDHVDSLLNYIVNISRDDPITVDQVRYCTYNYFRLLNSFHCISKEGLLW
jgi:hypothetical protein